MRKLFTSDLSVGRDSWRKFHRVSSGGGAASQQPYGVTCQHHSSHVTVTSVWRQFCCWLIAHAMNLVTMSRGHNLVISINHIQCLCTCAVTQTFTHTLT